MERWNCTFRHWLGRYTRKSLSLWKAEYMYQLLHPGSLSNTISISSEHLLRTTTKPLSMLFNFIFGAEGYSFGKIPFQHDPAQYAPSRRRTTQMVQARM